jgi:hypothetical protein
MRYFDRSIQDINDFVDTKYRPFIIQYTISDPQLRFRDRLQASMQPGAKPDIVDFMSVYTRTVVDRIERYREQLLLPVEQERDEVLASIDAAYQQLYLANATVTGHLASVVKVKDLQSELLAGLRLDQFRQQIAKATVLFSDQVASLTQEAQDIDTAATGAETQFKELPERIRALRGP